MPSLTITPNPTLRPNIIDIVATGLVAGTRYNVRLDGSVISTERALHDGSLSCGGSIGSASSLGVHQIEVRDSTNKIVVISATSFTIINPPLVTTLTYTSTITVGSTLSGIIDWQAFVTKGIASKFQFLVDGNLQWEESFAPWGGDFDTKTLSNGTHSLTIIGFDNTGAHAPIGGNVTISNTVTPPIASNIYGPAIGADSKGEVHIGRGNEKSAFIFNTAGGIPSQIAYNQRYSPDGAGYSNGTGGSPKLTLQGVGANGAPNGTIYASLTFVANSPKVNAERKNFLTWSSVSSLPAGKIALVFEQTDSNPSINWCSANCIWIADSTPQPINVGEVWSTEGSGNWGHFSWYTPVFDLVFTDGHHEGQGYYGVITGYEVLMQGLTKVREIFTPPTDLKIKAVWFRIQRMSGNGPMTVDLDGTVITTAISQVVPPSGDPLTGGKWVKASFTSSVQIAKGTQHSLMFSVSTDTIVKVMPIREVTTEESPAWKSRAFPEGQAQKTTNGTTWSDIYPNGDLQVYMELE